MKNQDIRHAADAANIKLWQVAEELGITDSTFSRRLRRELSGEEKAQIMGIIEQLKEADSNAETQL